MSHNLDTALTFKDLRTSSLEWRAVAWKELYENEGYCKKIIEKDMKLLRLRQIERIEQDKQRKKEQANEQLEQVKYTNLTKEERELKWRTNIEALKKHLTRNL